jgi:WD40 repeat protein
MRQRRGDTGLGQLCSPTAYLATLAFDRDLRLYDLEQEKLVYTGDLPHDRARLLAGSAEGRRLITCGWSGSLFLWALPDLHN